MMADVENRDGGEGTEIGKLTRGVASIGQSKRRGKELKRINQPFGRTSVWVDQKGNHVPVGRPKCQ